MWRKRSLHIKRRSLLISTSLCASLGNVGFHGLQDPPFRINTFQTLCKTPLFESLQFTPYVKGRSLFIPQITRPLFSSHFNSPLYRHKRPCVWGLHFQLEHDSDTICKDLDLDYIDIVCFKTHTSHGFVFLLKDIVMGEKASTY